MASLSCSCIHIRRISRSPAACIVKQLPCCSRTHWKHVSTCEHSDPNDNGDKSTYSMVLCCAKNQHSNVIRMSIKDLRLK